MVDILYAVIALVVVAILIILYACSISLMRNNNEGKKRIHFLFSANIILGITDVIWGIVACGIVRNEVAFNISTIAFYVVFAFTVYEWVISSLIYMKCRLTNQRKVLLLIPTIVQLLIAVTNPLTHFVFDIDGERWHYISGPGQKIFFAINIVYLMAIIHAASRRIMVCSDKFLRDRYTVVIIYSFVIAANGIMQSLFPKAPFVSIGCMIAASIVFARNIVADEKKELQEANLYYQNTSKEIYSAFEALAGSYVSIHIFDLKADRQDSIRTNENIDKLIPPGIPGSLQIKNVMENITEPDFKDVMVEFVNLTTLAKRMEGKDTISCEFVGRNLGWCISSFIRITSDKNGNPLKVIHAVQNINDMKTKELEYEKAIKEALKSKNTIFEEMLRAQNNGVLATEVDGHIIYCNDAGVKMMGYHDISLFPKNVTTCFDNVTFDNREEFMDKVKNLVEHKKDFEVEFSVNNDGKKIYISGCTNQFKLNDGRKIYILSLSDITKNKNAEEELKILSETDALTAIDNRRSGEQKIESLMETDTSGMLCILDVNKFKGINDTYGHQAGDIVLQKVAESLKKSFRDTDVVMRLGGDEFAVYAKELTDPAICDNCMDKLFKRIESIDIPECSGLKPTISVGIAFYNSKNKCSYSRLYQQADSVMYMSKGKGGNNYTVFKRMR